MAEKRDKTLLLGGLILSFSGAVILAAWLVCDAMTDSMSVVEEDLQIAIGIALWSYFVGVFLTLMVIVFKLVEHAWTLCSRLFRKQ